LRVPVRACSILLFDIIDARLRGCTLLYILKGLQCNRDSVSEGPYFILTTELQNLVNPSLSEYSGHNLVS